MEKLEVSSFNEFLEKFAPDVYEICERNGDGKPEFIYTTDKSKIQGRYAVKQSITDHAYYKMLSDLYYQKVIVANLICNLMIRKFWKC